MSNWCRKRTVSWVLFAVAVKGSDCLIAMARFLFGKPQPSHALPVSQMSVSPQLARL